MSKAKKVTEKEVPVESKVEVAVEVVATKTKSIYEALRADFPERAYTFSTFDDGTPCTQIKPQYIVERLNEVLGLGGWNLLGSYEDLGQEGVLFFGSLVALVEGRQVEIQNVGHSEARNVGNAYKGARTDCLSKCASWLGVGNEVFKGNVEASQYQPMQYGQQDFDPNALPESSEPEPQQRRTAQRPEKTRRFDTNGNDFQR